MPRNLAVVVACAALALAACGAPAANGRADVPALPTSTGAATVAPAPADTVQAGPTAPEGSFAVGDSVMLGSRPTLRRTGFRVDAEVGRQFGSAVSIVRRAASRGALPRNVVVHLGTNGTVTLKACKGVVRYAGPERKVFLVNVRVPRSWQDSNNRTLDECAAAFGADRVEVVDWAAYSAGHPAWFGPDRVHPTPSGRERYTALIEESVRSDGI